MRSPAAAPAFVRAPFTHLARWPNWFGPMQVPGTVAQLVRAPLTYMAWWVNSFRLNFTSPARLSQLCWGVTLSWHGGSASGRGLTGVAARVKRLGVFDAVGWR